MSHTKRSAKFKSEIDELIRAIENNFTMDIPRLVDILRDNTTDSPCLIKAAEDEPIFVLRGSERRLKIERQLEELYHADGDTRIGLLPLLNSMEIELLNQCQIPVWDGNVISKSTRDKLWDKGLIDRWNGYQFLTIYGFAVVEIFGLIRKEFRG